VHTAKLKTASLAAVLLAVNCYVVRDLFSVGFINQMASIDGAHIGVARYLAEHWRDLGWFQLWYAGVPYQNTYPPLLRALVALAIKLSGAAPVVAYHFVTAALYALGPVTFFWMAWRISRSRAFSFGAAMFYSLVSPSALFGPAIFKDLGSALNGRRVQTLLQYGDGPHIASLTLIPLAMVALDVALEKRRPVFYVLAALGMVAVVLTNWLGAVGLAVAVIAYLLARPQTSPRVWLAAVAIGIYAYLVALPWIPPSTLAAISANSQVQGGAYKIGAEHLRYLGLGLIALAFLHSICERLKVSAIVRFAIFFTLPMAAIVLCSMWLDVSILPQPYRYQLEAEMGIAILAVFSLQPLAARMGRREKAIALAGFLLFCWFQARHYRHFTWWMDRPIDIRSTFEYQAAQWFDHNLKGQRVLAPGSVGFWLTTFNDTPQLSGGFDQGLTNRLLPAVTYQLYTGEGSNGREDEIGELWLKVFGVQAVMVGGPHSREVYRPFSNPHKFASRFRVLWRDGDDVTYEVPARSRSLAHVMKREDLAPRMPAGGVDIAPLRPYVAALDNPAYPLADFRWLAPSRAAITANLERSQILSVQISYHPGWHARVNGRACRVYRDHLDLLVIEPGCDGPCTVVLSYDGGTEMWMARILSWIALLAGIVWIYRGARSTNSSTDSTRARPTAASSVE
jgi:hypothetical protein